MGQTETALREIVEGTAAATGAEFFGSLVRHLASALRVRSSLVTERLSGLPTRVRVLALWDGERFHEPFEYEVEAHPCAGVYAANLCHYPRRLREVFPSDPYLAAIRAESYLGIALEDSERRILGHLAVIDDRPMKNDSQRLDILKIFAARAGVELERLHLEASRESLAQMIVHDLRNPLVSVLGHLELLERGQASVEATRKSVRVVKRNTERLIRMVTDILDVARLEAGRMPLALAEVDLVSVVGDVAAEMAPLFERKSLRLLVAIPPSLAALQADREVLRRVLLNILSNAAAFSPRGSSIAVGVRLQDARVRVQVSDSGPGVPAEHRQRIFDKFGSVASQRHSGRHSSGLGLPFCKLAIEAHGGAIGIESEVGRGSTFWFTLARAAKASGARGVEPGRASGRARAQRPARRVRSQDGP